MQRTFFLLFLVALSSIVQAQSTSGAKYVYHINLNEFTNDQLHVKLKYKGQLGKKATFCLPKIIPGIYDATNFGKYVENFKALDKEGKQLEVKALDENCWSISDAHQLASISYLVNDGWESFDLKDPRPYRSAESTFNTDHVIISTPAIFGYFKTLEDVPFEINVFKPEHYYGATSLVKQKTGAAFEVLSANDYHQLVDAPILYAAPDTAIIQLPNIEVEVACYSSTGEALAREVATHIKPLLKSQTNYLGGKLPVSKYTFIIYHQLNPNKNAYISEGLEHASSTLVLMYLPNDIETIRATMFHTASHEFFHNIMPIALHSHEIENYNYNQPVFSKHLWLYEGMTEYFTIHMPVVYELHTLNKFIDELERKVSKAKQYTSNLSLTAMSLNPIEHQEQYMNIYFKGALFNLCLDIKLREWSKGSYGVQALVRDLIEAYGPNKPFEDDELFNEIVRITGYQELHDFFERYLVNNEPLPVKEHLLKVGLKLNEKTGKIVPVNQPTATQVALRQYWIDQ